ncbi:non-heme iron oxygenase ferredoxin subunit [Pseudorhodoferax sp.]|uniref:non-heme iron oxygenase ferredoxin subunit n=1 Tax=Pseudorhodoferax sp. TaxID=1993553 RepID=UPI002DD63BB8|nr:non-heme iron oxygenase ferredoxin subunit [Pseudorhodoferax sp.]
MTASDTTWHDVAALDDLPEGDVVEREVAGRPIALYRLSDGVFATDATCTHGNASLCGGFVEDDVSIECPLHQGRFDIRSGRALCAPLEADLAIHPVRVEAGRVRVGIAAA